MILLVNKVLTKPRVRGKTRHKTSIYSKLEKASMLIGTAGLLGGVIGPVIAPAEEVLAVSRSEMQKRAIHLTLLSYLTTINKTAS